MWIPTFSILIPASVPVFKNRNEQFDINDLKIIFRDSNIYLNNVVTKDFTRFNLIINLENKSDAEEYKIKLDALILDINKIILTRSNSHLKFYLAGAPLIDKELTNIVKEDLKLFVPLSIITSVLILIFVVRKPYSIMIVTLVSTVSLIWSLSTISITDTAMSVGLSVCYPFILVINIAY